MTSATGAGDEKKSAYHRDPCVARVRRTSAGEAGPLGRGTEARRAPARPEAAPLRAAEPAPMMPAILGGAVFRVHLELKRVQTWLFEAPRLRAMLGANVEVGELLAVHLPALVGPPSAPFRETLAHLASRLPSADPGDPLAAAGGPPDDPAAMMREHGVMSCAGGHFEVLVESQKQASKLAQDLGRAVRQHAPGLLFDTHVEWVADPPDPESASPSAPATGPALASGGAVSPLPERLAGTSASELADLPVFERCQVTGSGPAASRRTKGKTHELVCNSTATRLDDGRRLRQGSTFDVVGGLVAAGRLPWASLSQPEDIENLVGDGYLALVVADGNGMGARRERVAAAAGPGLPGDLAAERMYHAMRVAMRHSVVIALDEVCNDYERRRSHPLDRAGYQLLMLGGDDLLLACRASLALPFVVALSRAMAAKPVPGAEPASGGTVCSAPVSLGFGVAIARRTLPFHRLHREAEEMASSAKRLARAGRAGSVVDWSVVTGSYLDDPGERRRRDWLRKVAGKTLVLSGRPLPVLGKGLGCLEGLLAARDILVSAARLEPADGRAGGAHEGTESAGPAAAGAPGLGTALEQEDGRAARSQLRAMVDALAEGEMEAELALASLPADARRRLALAGIETPWESAPEEARLTRLLDLVEVSEIDRLGRTKGPAASRTEAQEG